MSAEQSRDRELKRRRAEVVDDDETESDSSRAETPPRDTSHSKAEPSNPATTSAGVVKKNAFAELMAKKAKPNPPEKVSRPSRNPYYLNSDPRAGLAAYLTDPASVRPASAVLFFNDDFVVIQDAFPKSTVHALILPRDIKVTHLQPLEVLNSDPELLASLCSISLQVRDILAKELRRIHLKHSELEQARQKAFEALEERAISEPGFDPDSEESLASLPPGRDWAAAIKIGVHSRPSMSNFHVHVISEDMHSERLKKKAHYNSFTSQFFVNLDEFPLPDDDRRIPGVERHATDGMLKGDMVCWRCKRNFGNKFKDLKDHLEVEYEAWKKI